MEEDLRVATENPEGEANNSRLQSFFSSLLTSLGGVFGHIHDQEDSVMASKALPTHHPRGEEGKQKNGQVERRNRRVLRDIGNLVTGAPVEVGKPQNQLTHPVTRNFCAQLLAKKQGEVEKNSKKPLAEVVNGVGAAVKGVAATKAALEKNELDKQKPRRVIIVGPEEQLVQPKDETLISARKLRPGSSKKTGKSLTSILSARSKAASGLANKPKDPAVNIDESDVDNELAVVEYVEDMYKFYKLTEDKGRIHNYMDSQPDINSKMRAILVDWLIEVHRKFELMPETLYLTINIVDRCLSMRTVSRRELQLVGMSSMLIACKYEEIWAPEVSDFIAISDNAYVREQVLRMEKEILGKLEWYLTVPTPYVFLVRYIKASVPSDQEMENMVFFLTDLGLMHYPTIISCCPSMLAASAVYAARCTLNKSPIWTETLNHHTGYSENQLRDCARLLVSFHAAAAESKLKAVYRKFSNPEKGSIALFPPARSLLAAATVSSS